MAEENEVRDLIVEKSAPAKSFQKAPPYISRAPFYFVNPTLFTGTQWRSVAQEPITRLCERHIQREITALEWEITSEDTERDASTLEYLTNVFSEAEDGEGMDTLLSLVLQDAFELPMGGIVELSPDDLTGMIGGLYHVDAATVYPTYDTDTPYVQLNPYNQAQRIWFERGRLARIRVAPRTDLRSKPFQEAPIETCLKAIEGMSYMYLYYMKQLSDTPMAGILDLMDMTQDEAVEWAVSFREMYNNVDPLKIPVLYDHTKPARFISFGRSPQDIQLVDLFKRYAELISSSFGLSIGDLRLFEHERTLAGVEASQRVTARQGIGFWAQVIEDFFNKNVLFTFRSGFRFRFKLGMTGEQAAEAALNIQRIQILNQLTGNQPLLKPLDAQKQMLAWKILDIKTTGLPQAPGLPGLEGFDQETSLGSMDQDHEAIQGMAEEQTAPLATIEGGASEAQNWKSLIRRRSLVQAKSLATSLQFEYGKSFVPKQYPDQWWYLEEAKHVQR